MDNFENKKEEGKEINYSKSVLRFILELVKITFISLAIIIPIRYFLIQPFYVKGASMEPSFYDHEYLIINEINYRFSKPQRGDVVVFRYPVDPRQYFIKRIIGLPGERVKTEKGEIPITEAPLKLDEQTRKDYLIKYAEDEEKAEYFVKVKWLRSFPIRQAVSELGFFGNQNSVCKPRSSKWLFTVDTLKKKWNIE